MAAVISVFCGGRCGPGDTLYELARELGAALAKAKFNVATGGYQGGMEAVSRGAAEAGGHVVGVTATTFSTQANRWVAETVVVPRWEDRLRRLISLGDGYVVCPGGTGTLVELATAWEMMHKRLMPSKPLVALGEFWRPVVEHVEAADGNSRNLVSHADDVAAAVAFLKSGLSSGRNAGRRGKLR
jgi:uncharacterized protein (TIGR00730 family)